MRPPLRSLRVILLCALVSACGARTGAAPRTPPPPTPTKAAGEPRFETYYLVLLRRGPKAAEISGEALERLQREHLAHLEKMAASGSLVIAGPFGEQEDDGLRGMCLYRARSKDEARALAEADPAVAAGRLRVEVMAWYVEEGYLAFPKAPPAP
jgi:uncharacterized protein